MNKPKTPRLVLELDAATIAAIQAPILDRLAALEARLGSEPADSAPWLTVAEAAACTGITRQSITRGIREQAIPGVRLGSRYRVSAAWARGVAKVA